MSKTYCAFPWTNLYVANFNQMMPCCNFNDAPQVYTSPNEFFHGEFMNKIREDMLAGREVKGCENCYFNEKAGVGSEREKANQIYGKVETPKLRALDIMLDNVCNLKCRMCNSGYSHSWKNDEFALYGRNIEAPKYLKNTYVDTIDLHEIERIILQGGEPFYSPEFEKVLDKLNEQNTLENVELWINTNATIIPNEKIVNYFKRFKSVSISLSLDAYDKLFEYIRKNADFEKVKTVLDFFHNLANETISFSINCTVTIYNVNHINEIKEYYNKNYPKFHWHSNYLTSPDELCISNTPQDFKEEIIKKTTDADLINILNNSNEDYFKYFVYYTETLDKLRKDNLEEANPWLWNYMQNYKVRVTKEEINEFYNNMFKKYWPF
jgi:MoaA/NifB/PqqE/SkfB family radical SAM enzyme